MLSVTWRDCAKTLTTQMNCDTGRMATCNQTRIKSGVALWGRWHNRKRGHKEAQGSIITRNPRQSANRNTSACPTGSVGTKAESEQVDVINGRPFVNEEIHQFCSCFAYVTRIGSRGEVKWSAGEFTPIYTNDVVVADGQVSYINEYTKGRMTKQQGNVIYRLLSKEPKRWND